MKKPSKIKIIPLRYILAMLITILEVVLVIGIVFYLCFKFPNFSVFILVCEILCIIGILGSDNNPDYKVPWLVVITLLPVIGYMLYVIFSSRKISKKDLITINKLSQNKYIRDDSVDFDSLKNDSVTSFNQFKMLSKTSGTSLFTNTKTDYFDDINNLLENLIVDLNNAKNFIFIEFFIIEKGYFWNSILKILKEKVEQGVDCRVIFDDIGCMRKLPNNYVKVLNKLGIKATAFSRLKGGLNSKFNNRNHRKLIIIDGAVCYTGGFNLADEYINKVQRFGVWKDAGIRLHGEAVWEFTRMFISDFCYHYKAEQTLPNNLYPTINNEKNGYLMPFGDGPKPLYKREVGKGVIQNLVACSTKYFYATTPYLIIDNDLLTDIENAALRGVDVRIVVPKIPDKKLINLMTKTYYKRLISAGVKIYEYTPGFIHAKTYLVDDNYAMIGTINLDYRSLVHHFENGVLMYKTNSISSIKEDILSIIETSHLVTKDELKDNVFQRILTSLVKLFAPLM